MPLKALLTVLLFAGSLFIIAIQDADAARFGGRKSFGSKPSMQRSTTAPKQQQGVTQAPPGASAAQSVKKPGLLGGMGGMFGGLLAGTLLGSLLFGGDFDGGGIMDILLIALLLFLAFKLFARIRGNSRPQMAGGYASQGAQAPHEQQGMHYQSTPQQNQGDHWSNLQQGGQPAAPAGPQVPEGFDVEDFLKGAKMAFSRLQTSWDKRDLEDIALFTSPAVLEEVKAQLAEDPTPSQTEVLLNNAQLLSVKEENGEQLATVYFDVLMREAPTKDTAQVREVWHFIRPAGGGSWKLDGIQQVEP